MDDRAGWVFLPGEGSRMHHTAPGRPGWTWCDRQLDATVEVFAQVPRRAFSICVGCRTAGAQYPLPSARTGPGPAPMVDGRVPGWAELPADPGVLHRPDPRVPDRVLCGQVLPGSVPIHRRPPRSWPACDRCQQRLGRPASRQDQPPRAAVPVPAPRQTADRPARRRDSRPAAAPPVLAPRPAPVPAGPREPPPAAASAGADQAKLGWVRLPGRLLHRCDPVARDRVACGKPLPAEVPVLRRPPQDWPPCPACAEALPRRLATATKRGLLDESGQPKTARRTGRRQGALLRSEDLLAGWRSPGWVVLADKKRSHRRHPDQPGHVLCGRRLPAGTPVERTRPAPLPCQRCVEVLHRQQEKLGLRTVVITSPSAIDRYDRARQRGTSIWTFRGGLPTLGRGH